MKVIGIILTAMLLFSACKKDDVLEFLPEMSASIDGAEWVSVTRVTVEKDGNLIVTGTSITGEVLVITIFGNTPGNYELSLVSQNCGAVLKKTISSEEKDTFVSVTGNVSLSEVNTSNRRISGTFSFSVTRLTETKIISSGKFSNLTYTVQ